MQALNLSEDETHNEVTFDAQLTEGNNDISVEAVSVDETTTVATETVENQSEEDRNIEISIKKSDDYDDRADIKITAEKTIKEIKLNVNDVDYDVNVDNTSFQMQLVEGNNKIAVTVVLEDGMEKTETAEIYR